MTRKIIEEEKELSPTEDIEIILIETIEHERLDNIEQYCLEIHSELDPNAGPEFEHEQEPKMIPGPEVRPEPTDLFHVLPIHTIDDMRKPCLASWSIQKKYVAQFNGYGTDPQDIKKHRNRAYADHRVTWKNSKIPTYMCKECAYAVGRIKPYIGGVTDPLCTKKRVIEIASIDDILREINEQMLL
jgi:hypothetical protein